MAYGEGDPETTFTGLLVQFHNFVNIFYENPLIAIYKRERDVVTRKVQTRLKGREGKTKVGYFK